MGLQRFERGVERLVEGIFSKAFRSGLQPVEISRRLAREMDLRRTVGVSGIVAPNRYSVVISEDDAERFESFQANLDRELVDSLREHARNERYSFMGPVTVDITTSDRLRAGTFEATGQVVAQAGGGPMGTLILPDGRRIELGAQPIAIGRLPNCAVNVSDPNVSRRHAEVRRNGNEFIVVDLGSTNGTRVNGSQVAGERRLRDGDVIGVGSTSITFEGA